MSEPYDTVPCPFCDSTDTLEWGCATAYRTGWRKECLTCKTRWHPASSDISEVDPPGWALAGYATYPSWPEGGDRS